MRMTVTIADDVRAEMERTRAEQGIGPSEALNTLARRGMMRSSASPITLPALVAMGARFDLTNIGEVLEILDSQEPGS